MKLASSICFLAVLTDGRWKCVSLGNFRLVLHPEAKRKAEISWNFAKMVVSRFLRKFWSFHCLFAVLEKFSGRFIVYSWFSEKILVVSLSFHGLFMLWNCEKTVKWPEFFPRTLKRLEVSPEPWNEHFHKISTIKAKSFSYYLILIFTKRDSFQNTGGKTEAIYIYTVYATSLQGR